MTLAHIRAYAEEMAAKHNPEHVSPFPLEHIQAVCGDLRVYYTALDDDAVSGTILFKEGEFSILINTNKPATRQNFTLGHELGHYFLHQDVLKSEKGIIDGDGSLDGPRILYRANGAENEQLEIEANHFAASLIMPADLVRQAWQATESVEGCARIFTVSVLAMSIRLTRLGLVSE